MKRRIRPDLSLLVALGAIGCAGSDEIQPEDVTTADLSFAPGDDVPSDFGPPMDAPPPRPPEEAFQACAGLAVGAECRVAIAERALDGTCRQGPPGTDEELLCVPADLPPPPRHRRGHRGPPPQVAVDACANLAADATCAFEIDGHDVDGMCRQGPAGAALVCAPAHMPPLGGPPREALDACANRAADAACAFEIDGHDVDGACRQGPAGGGLACAPASMPPRGGPPREALAACVNLAADAVCSFEMDGHVIQGTCWAPPALAGAPLACAPPGLRNRPAPPPR